MILLTSFGYMALAVALIFASITFINGQLLPGMLAGVYKIIPGELMRTFLGCITVLLAANMLIARGYIISGQAIGGATYCIAIILGMVTTAMLVDGLKLNMHIIGGTLIMCAAATWVVYGMSNQ
tara:strand:+ start:464 stop:835 length:372 start_codon:yes stop_codon:yes gene_type:complete